MSEQICRPTFYLSICEIVFSLLAKSECRIQIITVAYAENFHGGFIQWHMVVICICCALFATSQFDLIFVLPNQRFGEVC